MIELKGARWYKSDLHLHTTASHCFNDKSVTSEEWVQECLDKGLNCVAVTDHNTGENIDSIKAAAAGTDLIVFPGVEVTCSDAKVHVLIIFDIDKGTKDVNAFLHRVGLSDEEFGKQDTRVKLSVTDLAEKARVSGAIVIPAHIDQFNGLGGIDTQIREEIFESELFHGFQAVHDFFLDDPSLNINELKLKMNALYGENKVSEDEIIRWKKSLQHAVKKSVPIVTFSDNPESEKSAKHGLWGIGRRYTWFKMDEKVTLESLRQALLMSELRIHNDIDFKDEPSRQPDTWINKLEISDTILNPKSINTLYFNPQMTALIGGRGTGKSGITRMIRGGFNLNNELIDHEELYNEQKKFYKVQTKIDNNQVGVLSNGSTIEISLIRYENLYKIKAYNFQLENQKISLSMWDTVNEKFDEIEEEKVESMMSLFQLEIYSQKQIYEIAKKPNALREKIDSSIEEMKLITDKRESLKDLYRKLSSEIRVEKNEVNKKNLIEAEIRDREAQLKKLKEGNYQELFEKNKVFINENQKLKAVYENLINKKSDIEKLRNNFTFEEEINLDFSESYNSDTEKWNTFINNDLTIVSNFLLEAERKLHELTEKFSELVKESKWSTNYDIHFKRYRKLKEELSPSEMVAVSNLEKISEEITERKVGLEKLIEKEKKIEVLKIELDQCHLDYLQIRNRSRELRQDFINSVLENQKNIKINVKKFRDRINFEKEFREILSKDTTFTEEINKVVNFCFNGDVEIKVPELINILEDVRKGKNNELITGRFLTVIKELKETQMDELKLLRPEDEIEVSYESNDGKFIPLSNASPGQKTSAILTFLLSHGNTPLILDQPEDDLDNHLIYQLIVERIKATKSKRQIIVVTHNANIPVNGDAELVIVMDSSSKNISPLYIGSIENETIKNSICNIMEGGADAFKLRAKRYNIPT